MKRKWWKFLLPIPFIFFYCYCISFPERGGKEVAYAISDEQQEHQVIQRDTKEQQLADPPPAPPPETGSQSPPLPSEESVEPVPQTHAAETHDVVPIESEQSKAAQTSVVPKQNTSSSSTPPPLGPAATQTLSSPPAPSAPSIVPLPAHTAAPAVETKAEDEDKEVIIALVTLSSLESEKTQEMPSVPSGSEQAQPIPSAPEESAKKQQAAEYARSTAKVSVSQETFEADKRRIMSMISDLDVYMETGDYKGWSNCLSEESRTYWSKPQNLRKAAAKLPISGIKLNNMEDYFNYVFIPARKGRKVEEIRYVTETQVKAVQVEEDVDMVFYHFKKVDGKWRLFLPKIKD